MTTNTTVLTILSMKRFGFNIGDSNIEYGNVKLYPTVFFAPLTKKKRNALKNQENQFIIDADNTYCVHHGTATWYKKTFYNRIKAFFVGILRALLGHKNYIKIKSSIIKRKLLKSNIE